MTARVEPVAISQISITPAVPLEDLMTVTCFNGPCQGSTVDAPKDATPGTACALQWKNVSGHPRYAVYMLVDYNGTQGLMFVRSYDKPDHAANKVRMLSAVCAANLA